MLENVLWILGLLFILGEMVVLFLLGAAMTEAQEWVRGEWNQGILWAWVIYHMVGLGGVIAAYLSARQHL